MMERDLVFGIIMIISGLSFITYLVLWSRKIIERIAEKRLHSVREIVRELHHGR